MTTTRKPPTAMSREELEGEVARLRGICDRNKAKFLALQNLAAEQRVELERLQHREVARKRMHEAVVRERGQRAAREVQFQEMVIDAMADLQQQQDPSEDN